MSDIKSVFTSRFGDNGRIIEADYSQLEVIVLAFLSQDEQLLSDIRNKVDIHGINASKLFGVNYTEAQRKLAKRLSFQLQYGSGAKNMAQKNKIPVHVAKTFIANYYTRYPRVKEWQDEVYEAVKASRELTDKHTVKGLPLGSGTYRSITGREYVFFEYDNPYYDPSITWKRQIPTSFSPTETKNYPVQGFATGDIVPMIVGKLYRAIKADPIFDGRVLLINTIHDSILIDCQKDFVPDVCMLVKTVMEKAPEFLYEEFGIEFDLPLPVGLKVGKNWGDMEEWKC